MADEADSKEEGGNGTAENKSGTQGDAKPDSKAAGKDDKTTETEGTDNEPKITLTQKALDDMIEKRLKREREKAEKDAKLSETDRLKQELEEQKAALRSRDARDAFVGKLGLSGEVGQRVYRAFADELDIDDKGKITNLDDVVKQAKAAFPQLFQEQKKGSGDGGKGGSGGGSGGAGTMNDLIRRGR